MKKNTEGAAQIKTTMADNAGLLHKSKTLKKVLGGVSAITTGAYGLVAGNFIPAAVLATGWMGQDMLKTHIKRKSKTKGISSTTLKEAEHFGRDTSPNLSMDLPKMEAGDDSYERSGGGVFNRTPNVSEANAKKVRDKFDATYMKSGSPKMINKLRNIGK